MILLPFKIIAAKPEIEMRDNAHDYVKHLEYFKNIRDVINELIYSCDQ